MAARMRRDGQAPEMRFRQVRVNRAQRAILMMAASWLTLGATQPDAALGASNFLVRDRVGLFLRRLHVLRPTKPTGIRIP